MPNFELIQVYERVPLRGVDAQAVVVEGIFTCPGLGPPSVPVQLRVTAPVTVPSVETMTLEGTPFPGPEGFAKFVLPPWASKMVGDIITFEVRGNCRTLPLLPDDWTPWESISATVMPRSDRARPWIRKLDGDLHVVPPSYQPTRRWYPATLDHLLYCVQWLNEPYGVMQEARAIGSHWGISSLGVTPSQMIETATPVHEPDGDQAAGRLNKALYEVIPECLTNDALAFFVRTQGVPMFDPTAPVNLQHNYLFHVEAGIRVHELYAYIDGHGTRDFERENRSLAVKVEQVTNGLNGALPSPSNYYGPWALETMGGAGGQTIMGVASTATHGGDVNHSAIGELIVAMHLIAPDGQEYWIERTQLRPSTIPMKLIDENLLCQVYRPQDPTAPGGRFRRRDIIYLRDDDLMDAAIVSCGRMGIVYSVVLRTVRQYALTQMTTIEGWDDVKPWLCTPTHLTHQQVFGNRFVRIDVDLYPEPDFDWHDAALTFALLALTGPIGLTAGVVMGLKGHKHRTWRLTRTLGPLQDANVASTGATPVYKGRAERGGATAGSGTPLAIENDDGMFSDPCGSSNWVRQFLTDLMQPLATVRDAAIASWLAAGASMVLFPPNAVWARPVQIIAERIILFTEYWILMFSGLREILPVQAHFGDFLCAVMNTLADLHAHSIIQMLYCMATEIEHKEPGKPLTGISYSVMDEHNYRNKGCVGPGDSIELFMDADDPKTIEFVDSVITVVRDLSSDGKAFGGYLSMRFMTESPSILAMQRWTRTVSFEIAGLSRASGTEDLLSRIEEESKARRMLVHWGQRNNRSQKEIENEIFLGKWRDALSQLSQHGRLAHLSTEFTRFKGLEVTVPRVYSISASLTEGCATEMTHVNYDGFNNPPGTQLTLVQRFADQRTELRLLPSLKGTIDIPLGRGVSTLELQARRELNGNRYDAAPIDCRLHGFATGDVWEFRPEAEPRLVGSIVRWFVEINLFSSYVSNQMLVSEVTLEADTAPDWVLRKAETGDIPFPGLASTQVLSAQPRMNTNWQFFTVGAVPSSATAPNLRLLFKMIC